jgi:hypothetical protein
MSNEWQAMDDRHKLDYLKINLDQLRQSVANLQTRMDQQFGELGTVVEQIRQRVNKLGTG